MLHEMCHNRAILHVCDVWLVTAPDVHCWLKLWAGSVWSGTDEGTWKPCHRLLTLMFVQTWTSFFLLLDTKEDILKNVWPSSFWSPWRPATVCLPAFNSYGFGTSKWWQSFHLWPSCPLGFCWTHTGWGVMIFSGLSVFVWCDVTAGLYFVGNTALSWPHEPPAVSHFTH